MARFRFRLSSATVAQPLPLPCCWPLRLLAGTVPLPDRVPVAPLAQLNLKLSPVVLADWRRRAREAGHGDSVRDWLVATLAPAAEPQAVPAGGSELLERLQALEATTAQLAAAVAQLQASPRRSPQRVSPSIPPPGEAPSPERVSPATPTGDLPPPPAGAVTTAELAERTGTNRAAWNNWAGSNRVGQVRHHPQAGPWRLVGQAPAPGGGPLRWLWVPAEG